MVSGSQFSTLRIFTASCILAGSLCGLHAASGAPRGADQATPAARAKAVKQYGGLPLSFEANHGQADKSFAYLSRGVGYSVYLNPHSAVVALRSPKPHSDTSSRSIASSADRSQKGGDATSAVIRMDLSGASTSAPMIGDDRLPGNVNYILGNDTAKWHSNVETYSRVRATGVYPGIDLVYYGNRRQLEYDFVVAPHADPSRIRLHFAGAGELKITAAGDLAVSANGNGISFQSPIVYQQVDGRRRPVAGHFELLAGNMVGFSLGSYDHAQPLVIDPTLVYATYLGGSAFPGDEGDAIAVDKSGNVYIAGATDSADFPVTQGAFQTVNTGATYQGDVVFVTKLNAAGTGIVYSTFIGGSGGDHVKAVAVDQYGCAHVTGITLSHDYPATVGAFMTANPQTSPIGIAFVSKLTPDGSGLVYSTFLGGTGADSVFGDEGHAIAVDANDDAYVAGLAYSSNFPVTVGAYQTSNHATAKTGSNAFITKFNDTGTGVFYSTYLGGKGAADVGDSADAVAVDAKGNAYVGGYSYSSDFPVTASALQKVNHGLTGGAYTAFVSKVNPAGTALLYSTYLGGSGIAYAGDRIMGLAVDAAGDAYAAGLTYSSDFPVTAGAFQTSNIGGNNGSTNAFVSKVNPAGSALIYSTYIGGTGLNGNTGDYATGIGLDASGNAYVSGSSYSVDFPVTANALQKVNRAAHNGEANPFVAQVNAAASNLLYSTYLGGSGADIANGMASDAKGNVYITGISYSSDFPVTAGVFQKTNLAIVKGGTNAFAAKLSLGVVSSSTATGTALVASANPAAPGASVTFTATVTAKTGTAIPAGSVVFSVDGVAKATVALVSGKAKFATATLTTAAHVIKAAYAGNTTFTASSASLTETIKKLTVAAPKFTPAAGLYAPNTIVKLTTATVGATIHYTINGAAPTATSPKYTTAGIKVAKTETIKAIAVATGYTNSPVASAAFTIKPAAPKPVFHPGAETFKTSVVVKLTDTATAGLVMYYTTNGAAPTTASTKYTAAGIKVTKTETIKAIAIATGYSKSAVVSAKYTLQ